MKQILTGLGAVLFAAGLAFTLFYVSVVQSFTAAAAASTPSFDASTEASTDIPTGLIELYQTAAEQCLGLDWQLLAGIGKVESDHGRYQGSAIESLTGQVKPPIIGIPLNGTNNTMAIPDTDGGRYDGDATWDRAVGPFQFIPTSWVIYGQDGNGDGVADPNNVYDAVPAAVKHLCPNGSIGDVKDAVFGYNGSNDYVQNVLGWADKYSDVGPITINGEYATVGGIKVAKNLAPQLSQLLADAKADGLDLQGSGWRNPATQIQLRKDHCGESEYAIWQMPSSSCSPPTARPGRSQHEIGLAVDFKNCSTRSTACYRWLASNAARYGFINLPSEPWHWSTTGR